MNLFQKLLITTIVGVFSPAVYAAQWEALPEKPPVPEDNPQTQEKIKLGKILFFDPRVSKSGNISCNSCHNVMAGGDDDRATSLGIGHQAGPRNAPTVWNSAFLTAQFWDGRAATLEEQAKGPIVNPVEMGMKSLDDVISRLKKSAEYEALFKAAFGDEQPMTIDNAVKAIAAYERTLITPNSPYDRYVTGEQSAMSEQQVKGMNTFAEVGCTSCHSGPTFSGSQNKSMGEGFFMKFPTFPGSSYEEQYQLTADLGRYEVTEKEADKHMWRVPILRNVALTAPYFHNGSVSTLDEAVRVMAKTQLDKTLTDEQVKDIVAFLNALSGEFPKEQLMPHLPEIPGATMIPVEKAADKSSD